MQRRNHKTIGLLVIVAIVAAIALAVAVSMLLRGSGPFEGERSLDLGTKEMHGEPAVWTGAFSLRNVADEAVHVLALRPNCGCVQAELPRNVIPAGEMLEIPFTMTLERHGKRTAYIDVLLADERVVELRLDAEARESYRVTASPERVQLEPGAVTAINLIVEVHDGMNPPPEPIIDAPPGVAAQAGAWIELEGRRIGGAESRRWRCEVNVTVDESDEGKRFSDAEMTLRIGEQDVASVQLFRASVDARR